MASSTGTNLYVNRVKATSLITIYVPCPISVHFRATKVYWQITTRVLSPFGTLQSRASGLEHLGRIYFSNCTRTSIHYSTGTLQMVNRGYKSLTNKPESSNYSDFSHCMGCVMVAWK